MVTKYDYIVVGGGSSGCVVAAGLAKSGEHQVLLLEGGPRAEEHPETLTALGYKHAFVNDAVMGERFSTPQRHSANRRIFSGTGMVMGGSGSVNGMVYTRGAREDFAEWPEGWRWDDVHEDFLAVERVLRPNRRPPTQFNDACISAAEQNGFRHKQDLNDGDLSNVIGYEWMSYEGEGRRSSYVAFIKDAGPRDNLTILTGARVQRVVFDERRRATAVEVVRDGERSTIEAAHEIVLCAGALESAKLLLLSGVGPAQHLEQLGIPVVADRPSIGEGLHDHPNVPVFWKCKRDVDSRFPQLYSFYRTNPDSDLPKGQSDTCYVYWPAPSAMKQMTQRMLPTMLPAWLQGPRIKAFIRVLVAFLFSFGFVQRFTDQLFGIIVILGKPKSRGRLRLRSKDPASPADIDLGYYEHPEDLETMVKGVRLARALGNAGGLKEWGSWELQPGSFVKSDAAIAKYVRKNSISTFHFAGTLAMGTSDEHAVDTELKLRGVTGVRVADASVIPVTPVSALNAPSMLIGYRCAKYLLAARGLAPSVVVGTRDASPGVSP